MRQGEFAIMGMASSSGVWLTSACMGSVKWSLDEEGHTIFGNVTISADATLCEVGKR